MKVLFVSRYPQSKDLCAWLKMIPNRYIHFGDFDLAGVSIFLSEFYSELGERAEFYIPADVEQRLQMGITYCMMFSIRGIDIWRWQMSA